MVKRVELEVAYMGAVLLPSLLKAESKMAGCVCK